MKAPCRTMSTMRRILCGIVLCLGHSVAGTDMQHHTEHGKWEVCSSTREIEFSGFFITLEGSIEDGYMILEVEGNLQKPIHNGSYDFKVTHVEEGEEIAYKGPYDLCCTFFEGVPCTWEGTYPHQELRGGCPVPVGPFKARIRRPLWIKSSGIFRAEINLYTETGVQIGCVRSWGRFESRPALRGIEIIDSHAGGGGGTGLVPLHPPEEEDRDDRAERRWKRTATLGSSGSSRPTHVVEREPGAPPPPVASAAAAAAATRAIGEAEKEGDGGELETLQMIRAGRNWTGTYRAVSECGEGCCCLHDDAASFSFEDKVVNDRVWGRMSVSGQVAEGSPGACKGHQRMNMRNFVFTKSGDLNTMEKHYCQSACQTVRARRRITEDGRVEVSLLNVQHPQCGAQRFLCYDGPCIAAVDLADQAHTP